MSTKVFLIGGFHEARHLACSLIKKGYKVAAINEKMDQCEELASVHKLEVFHGDGSKPYVLDDAGVYNADIVIAMSPYDDANLVICELCKKKYNVGKTVALIKDPNNTEFFKAMGVDSVVCSITLLSEIIEQHATFSDIKTIMPIGKGKVQVKEIEVPEDAVVCGKRLSELDLPNDSLVGCIIRGDDSVIPNGDTVINAGDSLIVIVSEEEGNKALRKLTEKNEK